MPRLCKGVSSAEGKFCLTPVAIESLSAIKSWDWSQVLLWLCYISLGAWFGLIFTTPTYMCLSALRTALAPQGMFVASAVYFMVGEFLFLLPPVPGPAVYVAGSMILPPIVSEEFGGGERGFWLALSYCIALFYAMKMMAHVIQQKVFGEGLGKMVAIRSLIGVNSDMMKAIRYILSQKGFSVAKVHVTTIHTSTATHSHLRSHPIHPSRSPRCASCAEGPTGRPRCSAASWASHCTRPSSASCR